MRGGNAGEGGEGERREGKQRSKSHVPGSIPAGEAPKI